MLKRIAKSSFFSLSSRSLMIGYNFFLIFIVSKYLSPVEFGEYSIAYFCYYFFSNISSFGLSPLFAREIAAQRDNPGFKKTILGEIILFFLVSLLFSIILLPTALILYNKIPHLILLFATLGGLLFGIEMNIMGIFLGEEKMNFEFFAQTLNFLTVTTIVLFFASNINVLWIFIIRILSSILSIILRLIFLGREYLFFKINFNLKHYFKSERIYFFFTQFSDFLIKEIDVFILSFFISKELVGQYFLALRIYFAFGLLPQIFSVSILPFLSRTFNKKEKLDFSTFNKRIIKYFMFGAVLTSIILFFTKNLLISIFSTKTDHSSQFLFYFSFIIFFRFISFYTSDILTTTKFQDKRFYINIISSIIFILLSIILGSFFSVFGVLAARIVTELVLFFSYWFYYQKIIENENTNKSVTK